MKKNRILIVEDDSDMREMLEDILAEAGYETLSANNGRRGLRLFTENRHAIDMIITDVWMPQMNGAQLFRAIREIDAGLPIIIMTGFDWVEYAIALRNRGQCAFLPKPFQTHQLLRACQTFLNKQAVCYA